MANISVDLTFVPTRTKAYRTADGVVLRKYIWILKRCTTTFKFKMRTEWCSRISDEVERCIMSIHLDTHPRPHWMNANTNTKWRFTNHDSIIITIRICLGACWSSSWWKNNRIQWSSPWFNDKRRIELGIYLNRLYERKTTEETSTMQISRN